MNILTLSLHPLLVHFPIALLSLYCLIELISWGKLRFNQNLVFVKVLLATLGGLSLLLARQYGEQAASVNSNPLLTSLIEKHELFSTYCVIVFGIIGAAYLLVLISMLFGAVKFSNIPGLNFLYKIQKLVTETLLANILALAGLIFLVITGALGGAIVYGPSADPITDFVFHLFF